VFVVRRRYLVALALAVVAGVASLAVPPIVASIRAQQARADLAAANTAFSRLRVPADFRPWPAADTIVCPSGLRCYYAAEPTTAIAKGTLVAILRGVGAQQDAGRCYSGRMFGRPPIVKQCTIYARLDGLYVYVSLQPRGLICEPRCRRSNEAEIWIAPPFTPPSD
jgi:hypothetical protein